jgi:hypothetical protein
MQNAAVLEAKGLNSGAAESAARSAARSAAWSAAYILMAHKLIELIKAAPRGTP